MLIAYMYVVSHPKLGFMRPGTDVLEGSHAGGFGAIVSGPMISDFERAQM